MSHLTLVPVEVAGHSGYAIHHSSGVDYGCAYEDKNKAQQILELQTSHGHNVEAQPHPYYYNKVNRMMLKSKHIVKTDGSNY